MNPTERIINVLEGKPVDRVPTFCAGLEDRTFNEVLGKPLISQKTLNNNYILKFFMDRWGDKITKPFVQPTITSGLKKRIQAAAIMGFDSTWALYDETFILLNSKEMARSTGSIFEIEDDGYVNLTYMYKKPGIQSRKDFEEWPYWPDTDKVAHNTYKFFKEMMKKYGEKMCLFGQGSAYGIQESLLWAIGFERMPLWIRKEKDLIEKFINITEELCLKTYTAMLDAGVKIILQSDDFAFKTGPLMNPKLIDKIFGPSYKKLIKAVHQRGGKYILHSCGDNTLLFDIFIQWGVDGLHAYENTSTVDIFNEKKIRGDQTTIIGGVGIDYLLTDRSKDEEIVEQVKVLIRELGPKGRYIIGPIHGMSSIPAHKMKVMIDAVKKYGNYPIVA